jgi:hypothetical protein
MPRRDPTQLVSLGGAYWLAIPTAQSATIVLGEVRRICKIINGVTTQAGSVTFYDPDQGWTWFTAAAMAPNQIIDLNIPTSNGNVQIIFSAATSGPITLTLI